MQLLTVDAARPWARKTGVGRNVEGIVAFQVLKRFGQWRLWLLCLSVAICVFSIIGLWWASVSSHRVLIKEITRGSEEKTE